ncbi:nucleotidyltransferase family protein [Aquimarina pacifica]|uniref:nucleotidyltransferase family protein n=1 Tax=Aquimarina pacifica TaxID=1296415 RepID=UPI0004B6EC87|nr:nucleotidyltransferase family protein [Aquimarina pacifica]
MDQIKVGIVLLAAGNSSRMGSPKQLLRFGNTTLLGVTIENALASKASTIACVLGANADIIKKSILSYDIEIVINSQYSNGLGSSIATGVTHLLPHTLDAVVVLLADQPFITSDYIDMLITSVAKDTQYVIASDYNGKKGVPAIFPEKYFDKLLKLNKDTGAKKILNSKEIKVKTVATKPNLLDIDTLKDYESLIKK